MKLDIVSQETKGGVCVIAFASGLKVRLTDDGCVEIKGSTKISDLEFAHIAAVRHTMKG